MSEIKRIRKLLSDHYNGDPWIDVNLKKTLNKIPVTIAAKKVNGMNSIWQITEHMIAWREALLKRIKGEHISAPQNNFFADIKNTSKENWKDTIKRLENSQKKLMTYLNSKNIDLDEVYPSGYSRYELIQAILLHDTYHLGQIIILKKKLN